MSSAASAPYSPPRRKAFDAKVAAGAAATPPVKVAAGSTLAPQQIGPYITLAIGSAMALFMYPHALTGALASSSVRAIRFNTMALPAYSFVLGLIALLGMMALAAGIKVASPTDAVPQLVLWAFPDWFAGFCLSAIALGALVPAAVMSIGAANTFTRNIWKPFVDPKLTPREESVIAKLTSLIVKIGALMVIFFVPTQVRAGPAIARRRLYGADLSRDHLRAVHALVQRDGAADRLGGGHDRGNRAVVDAEGLGSHSPTEMGPSLHRQSRHRPRLFRLQRPDGGAAQYRDRRRALSGDALEGGRRNLAQRLSR